MKPQTHVHITVTGLSEQLTVLKFPKGLQYSRTRMSRGAIKGYRTRETGKTDTTVFGGGVNKYKNKSKRTLDSFRPTHMESRKV